MEQEDIIWLASKAAEKGWDHETLSYGDDLYHLKGEEKDTVLDSIWEYVEEYNDYGSIAFREKYKGYKLY